jgi:hypothetical protein
MRRIPPKVRPRDKTEEELRQDVQAHLPEDDESEQIRKTKLNLRISAVMRERRNRALRARG